MYNLLILETQNEKYPYLFYTRWVIYARFVQLVYISWGSSTLSSTLFFSSFKKNGLKTTYIFIYFLGFFDTFFFDYNVSVANVAMSDAFFSYLLLEKFLGASQLALIFV